MDSLISYAEVASSFDAKKHAYHTVLQIYEQRELKDDTLLVFSMQQLAFLYWRESPDRMDSLARLALEVSGRIDYPYGVTKSKFLKGFAEDLKGNFDSALTLYFEVLEEMKNLKRLLDIPQVLEYIGIVYRFQGKFEESFSYYSEALKMYEARGDTQRIGNVYNSIGNLFNKKSDYEKSQEYYEKALVFKEAAGDMASLSNTLGNLANILNQTGQYEAALAKAKEVLQIKIQINDKYGMSTSYASIGTIYNELGQYDQAIASFEKSIEIVREIGQLNELASDLRQVAYVYTSIGSYKIAEERLKEAERIALKIENPLELFEVYKTKTRLDSARMDFESAFKNLTKTYILNDSLNGEERTRALTRLEAEFAFQKERDSVSFIQEKERLEFETSIANQRSTNQIIIWFLILVVLALLFIYLFYRYQQEANSRLSKLNEEIKSQRDNLELLNQTKTRFFSVISHDLRGPIGAIYGLYDLITDHVSKNYDVQNDESLSVLSAQMGISIRQLSKLLDSLLQWALSEEGLIPYHPEHIPLKGVIQENVDILSSQAKAKQIELVNNIAEEVSVYADKNSLMTILRNLINNAIKFTSENGKIQIHSGAEADLRVVHIKDSGVGMSEETAASLFDFDTPTSTRGTRGEKGTGLGLKLVYDFVRMNRGKIEVESKKGEGSLFKVYLPKEA